MPLHTFTVSECEISVFPVDADGEALTDNPLWLGASADNIQISDSLEQIEDRPTGVPYPQVHHGAELHEITIGRIWETEVPVVTQPDELSISLAEADLANDVRPAANAQDYHLRPGQKYLVVLKWADDSEPDKFAYRIYYGVTDASFELSGDQADSGKQATHKWRAEYYLT